MFTSRGAQPPTEAWRLREKRITFSVVSGAVATVIALGVLARYGSGETAGVAIVGGPLFVLSWLGIRARFGTPATWRTGNVLILAAGIKIFVAPAVRALSAKSLYGGLADPRFYFLEGSVVARWYWQGNLSLDGIEGVSTRAIGNNFVRAVGAVIAIVGENESAVYLVFSWFSFLGMWCFVEAFRVWASTWHLQRYAVAVCLLPSMLYWPSTAGKESWMVLWLGVWLLSFAYLTADGPRKLAGPLIGLVAAVFAITWIRPHMTLIAGLATLVALLATAASRRTAGSLVNVIVTLGISLPLVAFTVAAFKSTFGGADSIDAALQFTLDRTTSGNSTFAAQAVTNPLDFPGAFFSVVGRPFLWEASSIQMMVTAVEGLILLTYAGFVILRSPRHWLAPLRNPVGIWALVYLVVFVVAFSNVANFGILARQRSMLWPVLLVLVVAAPKAVKMKPNSHSTPP